MIFFHDSPITNLYFITTYDKKESVNNMTLYDKIKSLFTLPTAYEDWAAYRNSLTSYLIAQTNQVSLPLFFAPHMDGTSLFPTLAIIGAGACNDIDLAELSHHFSKITLIDCDEDAMKTAFDTYHLHGCPSVERMVLSLNGLNDSHYEKFCNKLQHYVQHHTNDFTPTQFQQYALHLLEAILSEVANYQIPLTAQSFDYICCFGVHSQLYAMFSYIYHIFESNLKELYFHGTMNFHAEITKRLQAENNSFVPKLHDALLACAKQALFIGLEQKRSNMEGGIEGAYQAFQDIEARSLQAEKTIMLWPFLPHKNIEYEMAILKISTPHKI